MEENLKIHNRFDVSVVDAETGFEKQTAVAYNVVTDNFFRSRLLGSPRGRTEDLLTYMSFGSGSGVPVKTDTTLFTHVGRKYVTTLGTVFDYPTSYTQKRIRLEATENVGANITEVGLEASYRGTFDNYYYLMTHAMLQDSEGNQISILKTDTDVIYITATFYCTTTLSGFGEGAIYPPADKNMLTNWILTGTMDSNLMFSRFPLSSSIELEQKFHGSKSNGLSSGTGNMDTLRLDAPVITFLDTEYNNQIIKHIGIPGAGAVTFPNHDIFPPYAVNQIALGTGDGISTAFSLKAPLIMSGSETIIVNGVQQVKDVDYTIDYESNCGDWYENYHSAAFSCKDTNIAFGNLKTITPSSNYYRDPLAWWSFYDNTFYPSYCEVTSEIPILIDFKEKKECNTLKIELISIPTTQLDNLVIEYSDDGVVWDRVSSTRTNQIWKWNVVSARYWRVYIQNYSWIYSLSNSPVTRDGKSYGCSFFLGKTVPGLKFTSPPAEGASIEASYSLEYPFKTANNLLRFAFSVQLQRG
jgi:hypothetical protein